MIGLSRNRRSQSPKYAGSTGDMTYSYYFEVPEDTSDELLSAMHWAIGDTIELPVHVVEADDADY